MKKSTIWSIAIALGIALAALIGTQFYYLKEVVESRQKQFDENVKRALYQAARKLELQEVQNNLEKELFSNETMHRQQMTATETAEALKQADADSDVTVNGTAYPTPIRLSENAPLSSMMSEKMRKKLLHQKELLNEVIYNTLYLPEDRPLEKRIRQLDVDNALKTELQHNGIDLRKVGYHFEVLTIDGREVERCPDFHHSSDEAVYREPIFEH